MKFLLIFLAISNFSFGQENKKTIQLENKIKRYEKQIKDINDSIVTTHAQLRRFKAGIAISETKSQNIKAIVSKGAKIREEPLAISNVLMENIEDKEFVIKDYFENYFNICNYDFCGFTNEMYVKINPELQKLIDNKKLIEEENKSRLDNELKKLQSKEQERLISKIGREKYELLLQGRYWIGMTTEMAFISFGAPDKVNRTDAYWGNSEQWVYSNKYLYFENGKLTAIQH